MASKRFDFELVTDRYLVGLEYFVLRSACALRFSVLGLESGTMSRCSRTGSFRDLVVGKFAILGLLES